MSEVIADHSFAISGHVSSLGEWEPIFELLKAFSERPGNTQFLVTHDHRYEVSDMRTVKKVYEALAECGLSEKTVERVVAAMERRGILFREKAPLT